MRNKTLKPLFISIITTSSSKINLEEDNVQVLKQARKINKYCLETYLVIKPGEAILGDVT